MRASSLISLLSWLSHLGGSAKYVKMFVMQRLWFKNLPQWKRLILVQECTIVLSAV